MTTNPLGAWLPLLDVSVAAHHLGLRVASGEHPVADRINRVRDQHRQLTLSYGHFTAVAAAVAPGWVVDRRAVADQMDRVAGEVEAFLGRVQDLAVCLEDNPEWESVIVLVIDAVTGHFDWLMRAARSEPGIEQILEGVRRHLEEAWAAANDRLFFDRDPAPGRQVSLEAALELLSDAVTRFTTLWQELLCELTETVR